MKTGDRIRIAIISELGRKVDTVSPLRLEEGIVFVDVTLESSGQALKEPMQIELIPSFIEPSTERAEFRYRGEIRGAVLVPESFWNPLNAIEPSTNSPLADQGVGRQVNEESGPAELFSPLQPISFPLPNEIQHLIRGLPIRSKQLPEEYTNFLKKTVGKMGQERAREIAKIFNPLLKDVIKSLPEDATFEDVFHRLYEVQNQILAASPTLAATAPIIARNASAEKPESHASGVFIEIGGKYFLLTAAHVLDAGDHSDLYVGLNSCFVSLGGVWHRTRLAPLEDRKADNEDIGYCCLQDGEILRQLGASPRVLGRRDVIVDEPIPGPVFRACGYPATKSEVGDGYVATEVTSLEGFEIPPEEYEKLGLSAKENIAIRFNRKRMFSPRLACTITPLQRLAGMSGGGIYVEAPISEPPYVNFLLVGIITTHYLDKSLILGTRLNAFVRRIYCNYPGLFKKL